MATSTRNTVVLSRWLIIAPTRGTTLISGAALGVNENDALLAYLRAVEFTKISTILTVTLGREKTLFMVSCDGQTAWRITPL